MASLSRTLSVRVVTLRVRAKPLFVAAALARFDRCRLRIVASESDLRCLAFDAQRGGCNVDG